MSRQTEIKVFKPNSKERDYRIRHSQDDVVSKKAAEMLGQEAGEKTREALRSLRAMGADSLSFRCGDRKIRVELEAA